MENGKEAKVISIRKSDDETRLDQRLTDLRTRLRDIPLSKFTVADLGLLMLVMGHTSLAGYRGSIDERVIEYLEKKVAPGSKS